MTTAATLNPGAPLDNTMGSMLLGVIFSAVLYGISALQALFYFTRYGRDPFYLRVLVATTLFLDTVHLAFVTHTVYHYLIVNYYNRDALQLMVWSVSLEALPTGITAGLVQSFYAYRVWKLSHRNLILTGSIMALVMATAGCGTAWVVLALQATTYEHLLRMTPLTITINALSTGADLIITGTLCIMLHYTRPASLTTETMINKLILFTINTGLLTSCCAVASLISLILSRNTLIYALFYFCIGRLYSNALLASLNARSVIRGRINDVDTNFRDIKYPNSGSGSRAGGTISRNVFVHQASTMDPHELSIHIKRETHMYGDASSDDKGGVSPSDDKRGNASTATFIRET
ncbi:hypothetical protein FB45DRAFT_920422 [Roridomyces roridus]|uniref:DUF6534 domain-containing protein n=1 Tax=Roridomyces roridus TaxID=1738132 RepID=A0AAD7FLI9_9AGAR|nr:hypothetical protein FB45DRAFT_920422 [Roridomyces roridus]